MCTRLADRDPLFEKKQVRRLRLIQAMTQREEIVGNIAVRVAGVQLPHPVRVAIDGVDAAGKTMLAELAAAIERAGRPVIRASIDGFHNPRAIRRRQGSLSPEGYFEDSFNYPALIDALLQPLGPGGCRSFRRAVFDFRTDKPVTQALEHASADSILLFGGVFLLRHGLRAHFDFSVLVRAAFEVTLRRAEQRDASFSAVSRRFVTVTGSGIFLVSSCTSERRSRNDGHQ